MKCFLDSSSSHQKAVGIHPFGENICPCRSLRCAPKTILRYFFHLLIFNLLICLPLGNLYSQQSPWANLAFGGPTEEWARIFDGPDHLYDFAHDMALDTFGNIYVTGTITTTTQSNNIGTIKYNSSGVLQWQAFYNGPGSNSIDEAIAITTDKAGNIFVTGYSERGGFGSDDYATIKYNSSGTQLWAARYSGPAGGANDPTAICTDDSGYIYVTGFSSGFGTGDDFATIKYNQNGDSIWVRRYNGPANGNDYPSAITADKNGNVYVTGSSSFNFFTIKYNSLGNVMWSARYIRGFAGGAAIYVDNSGFVYVAGSSSTPSTSGDYATIKYDSLGVQQWVKIYNGIGTNPGDDPFDLKVDKNGNIYVTGSSAGINNYYDYLTIKYNSFGDSLWVRRYNGSGNNHDEARSITIDSTGNIYITGRSFDINNNFDITTVKYNSIGSEQWVLRYPGVGVKLLLDKLQDLYVLGNNSENGTNSDYITIKYSHLSGIIFVSNQIPVKSTLFQNYPNPFNPVTKINYQLINKSFVTLKIYSVLGLEINTLVNQEQRPGSYEISWNAVNYPSGVYFYRLVVNDIIIETKKMVYLA